MALAYQHSGNSLPGVLFLPGFHSTMAGTKAEALANLCETRGIQYTRFDYTGHGGSPGDFEHGTITRWRDDAIDILDSICNGPQVLVGSSMGGWIAALVALARPDRMHGLIGIAAAPDFIDELLTPSLSEHQKLVLKSGQAIDLPNRYDDGEPHRIRQALLDSGALCRVLNTSQPITCPVRLLHGTGDRDVPWTLSARLLVSIQSLDAQLILVKDADHRFSSRVELELIKRCVLDMVKV